jgi:hypothetical protein
MPRTTVAGGIGKRVAEMILSDHDPEGAMKFLLSLYPDRDAMASKIYSQYNAIRNNIIAKDPRASSPFYVGAVVPIRDALLVEGNVDDAAKVQILLDGNVSLRNQVQRRPVPYLDDEEMDDYLKGIDAFCEDVVEFRLPPSIVTSAQQYLRTRALKAQEHSRSSRDSYSMTKTEFNTIHSRVKDIITTTDEIAKDKDFWDLVFAIGVASGRRLFEILVTLEHSPGASDYQARVTGIAKQQWQTAMNLGEDLEYDIPLTVPYHLFAKAMSLIRNYKSYKELDSVQLSRVVNTREKTASQRCTGRKLTHTQKRNLYLEEVYRKRQTNKFHVDDRSCSRNRWFSFALCHMTTQVNETDRYSAMLIEDDDELDK